MNCTQIENLIPLYIEGDVEPGRAEAVRTHLQSCRRCSLLVAEYEESQGWLRSYTPPDFSDALFDDLRDSVRREIARESQRPSLFQRLGLAWRWGPVLTASVALLLICGGLAIYLRVGKGKDDSKFVVITPPNPKVSPSPPNAEENNQAGGSQQRVLPRPQDRPDKAARRRPPVAIQPKAEQLAEQPRTIQPEAATQPEVEGTTAAGAATAPDMLRIEIQTSAPNIRIIWLAPKEAKAPSSRTGADAE